MDFAVKLLVPLLGFGGSFLVLYAVMLANDYSFGKLWRDVATAGKMMFGPVERRFRYPRKVRRQLRRYQRLVEEEEARQRRLAHAARIA